MIWNVNKKVRLASELFLFIKQLISMIEYVRVGIVNSFISKNLFSSFDKRAKIENYKTKKCVPVPKERHLIVKNTHEAIIFQSDFDAVQSMIASRTHSWVHNHENLFKGSIYCSHCGNRMALVYQKENMIQ